MLNEIFHYVTSKRLNLSILYLLNLKKYLPTYFLIIKIKILAESDIFNMYLIKTESLSVQRKNHALTLS